MPPAFIYCHPFFKSNKTYFCTYSFYQLIVDSLLDFRILDLHRYLLHHFMHLYLAYQQHQHFLQIYFAYNASGHFS